MQRSVPCRDQLAAQTAVRLRPGMAHKPDLLRIDVDDVAMVIKDYAAKGPLGRLLGRIQIAREARAYRWLGPIEGIPRWVGRVDAHALAVEWIEGGQLAVAPTRLKHARRYVRELHAVMQRLHAAGLVHLDLRSNKNVLLTADDRVVLLDLASAVIFRPGSLGHRWIYPRLRRHDLTGYLKWKRTLQAGPFSAEEEDLWRRHRRTRALWLFNLKGYRWGAQRGPDA